MAERAGAVVPAMPSVTRTIALSVLALAIAGGVLAMVAVEPLADAYLDYVHEARGALDPVAARYVHVVAVGISAVTLLAFALHLSLRGPSPIARTFLYCLFFGWLCAPTSLGLAARFTGGHVPDAMLNGLVLGLCTALPLGSLYGFAAAIATVPLRGLMESPSLTTRYDAERVVGAVTFGAGAFATAVRLLGWGDALPWTLPALVAGFGALGLARAQLYRARLLALAADPTARGYERVPLAELGIDRDALWPLHGDVSPLASHALVRRAPETGAGGYRRTAPRVPLALVD
ncbi:MAG: hypothetical protein AB7S26_04620 [Sandaracinaceae bacterium]